jgi:hypothetical protein
LLARTAPESFWPLSALPSRAALVTSRSMPGVRNAGAATWSLFLDLLPIPCLGLLFG